MAEGTVMGKNNRRTFSTYLMIIMIILWTKDLTAQIGYHDVPYTRYEADLATLTNATATVKSYDQSVLQSEASEQICVDMSTVGSSVEWTVSAAGDGLVVRYSVPNGQSGVLEVYADNVLAGTLNLTTYYSWENLGFTNANPKMRFDEVRLKLPSSIAIGGSLKLVNQSGNIHVDFAELEPVPAAILAAPGDITYSGNGSDLQTFIDANGGDTIYVPAGTYNVNRELYFGTNNTMLRGAGMWYTNIHFTHTTNNGGLKANAQNISFSDLYLTTVRNSRTSSYKAINGVYTSQSTITNIWAEHFECGAWIGQYNSGPINYADGFIMSHCRFRNNYADGINLCKGTRNAIVEHCNFRNNGDDDMAIWSADGLECRDNTYRYCTSENCWRASGCAIYGGYNNKAHHLLIKDNVEVGIRVNNSYTGVGFNDNGMHEFSDITIIACGTFNDLWNGNVGAIDIVCDDEAGTKVKNVKFYNINIIDSKNDAIYINKRAGEGFYNLVFENITVNGTGKEYPENNNSNLNWGRGYGILFVGSPAGNGYYCNMNYSNRGGNATVNVNSGQIGTFNWTQACIPDYAPIVTSSTIFGVCDDEIPLTITADAPSGNTVAFVEFIVNNLSMGQDLTPPYSLDLPNPGIGNHEVKAIAHYTPSNTFANSYVQTFSIENGIYTTTAAPAIDGVIDAVWNNHASHNISLVSQGTVSSVADLSAYFKITRDDSYLYILVDVTDDILRTDGAANWQKDGIELYIDMGNDKSGAYVVGSDYQYGFVYGVTTPQAGLTFSHTTKSGTSGYIYEIRIPWTTLGGAPGEDDFMGFDLHVEDNDNGNRTGKKAWKDDTDNAWRSTSVLGTFQIASCDNPVTAVTSEISEEAIFNLYPNPFQSSANLKINAESAIGYSMNILDMNGKLINYEKLTGSSPYIIGENLLPGVYILEIFENGLKQVIKFVKL
jgi:hypothetical protein